MALLPRAESHARHSQVQEAIELLADVLRKMGELNALALLPEILRVVRSVIDDASQQGELCSAEALNAAYLPVIKAFGTFTRQNTFLEQDGQRQTQKLHPVIHNHNLVLVRDLIDQLSRLPGPSDPNTPRYHRALISKEILELLFDSRYLNADSMGFYLQYCTDNTIKRGSRIWWNCYLVALEGGNQRQARRFELQAANAAKQERKARRTQIADDKDTIGVGLRSDAAGPGEETTEHLEEGIGQMMRIRHSKNLDAVVPTLEPRLNSPPDGMTNHAWSHLLNTARRDKTVDADMLRSLHESVTESALNGHIMTATMLGYMKKGKLDRAWQVWLDLVDRQQLASSREEEGRYVDRVALAAATYICHALHGIDAAVTLVDSWAHRARSDPNSANLANSITLDARIVNILLHLCKIDRRPSIAFRLFAAAQPRWGVYTDAVSLSLLLDTARYTNDTQGDHIPDVKSRLLEMAKHLRPRYTSRRTGSDESYDAYDAAGFAKGSVSVLLDEAGYTWTNENDEPPWLRAKYKFEAILFTNWPWLPFIHSPLDYTHGPYAHKLRDFSSFFLTRQESMDHGMSTSLRLPSNTSYTHLVPSANAFHSYIALLGYYHLPEEIPRALAWMKALDIKPKKQTMITALMYIEEAEGPRRLFSDWDDGASRLLGDGDVLKRWMKDWLSRGVPTEDEVATYVREYMRRHKGMSR
jgi:hypothetical protein